jgi:hypothetical protein
MSNSSSNVLIVPPEHDAQPHVADQHADLAIDIQCFPRARRSHHYGNETI